MNDEKNERWKKNTHDIFLENGESFFILSIFYVDEIHQILLHAKIVHATNNWKGTNTNFFLTKTSN